MGITITKVTGIGFNPTTNSPAEIQIDGTIEGCEHGYVTVDCTTAMVVPIDFGTATIDPANPGGPRSWSRTYTNNNSCPCGHLVKVYASCTLGDLRGDAQAIGWTLNCDTCPQISGTMSTPGVCAQNNTRPVTLNVNFSQPIPTGATASVTWISGGPLVPTTTNPTGLSDSQTFNYSAGTYYPIAVVAITLASGQVCSTTTVTFGTLTVPACLPCPTLSVSYTGANCAPTSATLSFDATLDWPPGTANPPGATAYHWTIDDTASGKQAKRSVVGQTALVDTTSGWTGTLATVSGAVDLSKPGTYSISVHADVPGVDSNCDPARSIPIPPCPCPPGQHRDASGNCVDDPCPHPWQHRDANGNCVDDPCPHPWQHRDASGNCVDDPCPHPWQHRDASGNCVADPCPHPWQHRDASGNCVDDPCPHSWQHRDASGNCVDDPCPIGQHRDASGNCVPIICPPGQHLDASGKCVPDTGGFDFCCFLIWWWGLSHLVAGTLLYLNVWIAGMISAGAATIVIAIWIGVCCWPCALNFWKCCTLLKWVVMFNDALLITLFATYALGQSGNQWVIFTFGLVSTLVRVAMSASRCGSIPNIWDATTWPPCRCP